MTKYRQFRLVQKFTDKEITLNCWLPSSGLKVGFQVKLEAYPNDWWTISRASPNERELDSINTDWHMGGVMGEMERKKHTGLKITK